MSKAARPGKIFVDYLRNGHGASAIVPYSSRARARPVAMPVAWDELRRLEAANQFNVQNAVERLRRQKKRSLGRHQPRPPIHFGGRTQEIAEARVALGTNPPRGDGGLRSAAAYSRHVWQNDDPPGNPPRFAELERTDPLRPGFVWRAGGQRTIYLERRYPFSPTPRALPQPHPLQKSMSDSRRSEPGRNHFGLRIQRGKYVEFAKDELEKLRPKANGRYRSIRSSRRVKSIRCTSTAVRTTSFPRPPRRRSLTYCFVKR